MLLKILIVLVLVGVSTHSQAGNIVFAHPSRIPVEAEPRLHDPSKATHFPAMEKGKTGRTIPLNEWSLGFADPSTGFDRIRGEFESDRIILRPGTENPRNSYGWLETALVENVEPGSGLDGDQLVFQVRYNYPEGSFGFPPELRFRIHTEDFSHFAMSSVTHVSIRQGDRSGTHRVYFDRNLLRGQRNMRLFIDMTSFDFSAEPRDPDFPVEILETSYWTTQGGQLSVDATFSAVYIEPGGLVKAHVSNHSQPFLLRGDGVRIAWDATNLFVLTNNRRLYAFSAAQPGNGILVDDFGDVADISVLGNRVLYVTLGGEVWEWRGLSGTYFQHVSSGGDGVATAADGRSLLILNLHSSTNLFQLYRMDVNNTSAGFQPLTPSHSLLDMQGRWSRHY